MILKTSVMTIALVAVSSSTVYAHSAYWECAAASGSNEAAAANCGSRADFDRTGNLGGASAPSAAQLEDQRREQQRQQEEQEQQRRRDDERRNEETRRDEERRKDDELRRENDRLEEEARQQRSRANDSYYSGDDSSSSRSSSRRSRREPARDKTVRQGRTRTPVVADEPVYADDVVLPIELNTRATSLNVGAAGGLDQYAGYKIKSVKVETSTPGNSQVYVYVGGARVGGIKSEMPGEYEKDFTTRKVIRAGQKNLVLTTSGDVTILRVTVTLGR